MRNTSIIISFVLSAAVALFSAVSCASNDSDKTAGNAIPAPAVSTAAQTGNAGRDIAGTEIRIAYVHIDSLINNYGMCIDLRADFQKKYAALEQEMMNKQNAFQQEVADFQNKVQKGLITTSNAQQTQQQLMEKEQRLQQEAQQKSMELSEEEMVLNNRIFDAVQTYIDRYNADGRYDLILTTSMGTHTLISANRALDITQEILTGLNKEYQSKNSK